MNIIFKIYVYIAIEQVDSYSKKIN